MRLVVRGFAALVVAVTATTVRGEDSVLYRFEEVEGPLSQSWGYQGGNGSQAGVAELPAPGPAAENGPAGRGVHIVSKGQSALFTKSVDAPNWRDFTSLNFWVYRSPEEAKERPTSAIEIQLREADRPARFWRKIDIDHEGWKEYSVPLRFLRWNDGVPRWADADRLVFLVRDTADLWIDSIRLVDAAETGELSVDEMQSIAFPDRSADEIVRFADDQLIILSDEKMLEVNTLAEHLKKVMDAFYTDFDFLQRPEKPVTLLVFSTRERYEQFPIRYAEKLNSVSPAPRSTGYNLQGIAMSSWDGTYKTLRPVYTHEFVHSLVAYSFRIDSGTGDWLQEGLASYYQMKFHPQEGLDGLIRASLANDTSRDPLQALCSGQRIAMNRYWQAMTVCELLIKSEKYRPLLSELAKGFAKTGKSDLKPLLETVLNTTWDQLAVDWEDYCRKAH